MLRRPGIRHARAAPQTSGYTPIWPPTKLPCCVAWWDMLETYTESGGTVTAIRNMVSGSDDMAEATNPPALELTGLSGLPTMKADGSNDRLISTEAAVVAAVSGTEPRYALFTVIAPTAPTGKVNAVYFGAGNSGEISNNTAYHGRFGFAAAEDDNWGLERRVSASDTNSWLSGAVTSYAPQVVSYVGFGIARMRVNLQPAMGGTTRGGASGAGSGFGIQATTGALAPDRVAFFCRPDSNPDSFCRDRISAALLFDLNQMGRTLTLAEELGIIAGLMGRWRIPT